MTKSIVAILLLMILFAISCDRKPESEKIFQSALQAVRNDDFAAFRTHFTRKVTQKMDNLGPDIQKSFFIWAWKQKYGESGKMPETRNAQEFQKEQVMMLEVKTTSGDWNHFVFVREDGAWKIDQGF